MEQTELIQTLDELHDLGNCNGIGPEKFYPTTKKGEIMAKKICQNCIVIDDCLEYSITHREIFGVWGGKSERERERINRYRNATSSGVVV